MGLDLSKYFVNKISLTEMVNISQVNKIFNVACLDLWNATL